MTLKELVGGVEIIRKYYDDPDGYKVNAEYGRIILDATNKKMSDEDIRRLIELNWHQEPEECDFNIDFQFSEYKQEEDWIIYI